MLGSITVSSVGINIAMPCDCWTKTKPTNGEWANHADSMLLASLGSDANASFVMVFHQESSPMAQTDTGK